MPTRLALALSLLAVLAGAAGTPAAAQIALDRLVVELAPRAGATTDVEVRNRGESTAYVVVEPAEVVAPGTPEERRRRVADPAELGLLAAPSRLVLEPGARRVIRFARLEEAAARERVWRVRVRPVSGPTTAETSAVQVLVGYAVLVVGRPPAAEVRLRGERAGGALTLVNDGNSNALLLDGRHCDPRGERCLELPAKRLYAGNRWTIPLRWDTPATFRVDGPAGKRERSF